MTYKNLPVSRRASGIRKYCESRWMFSCAQELPSFLFLSRDFKYPWPAGLARHKYSEYTSAQSPKTINHPIISLCLSLAKPRSGWESWISNNNIYNGRCNARTETGWDGWTDRDSGVNLDAVSFSHSIRQDSARFVITAVITSLQIQMKCFISD